MTAGFSVPMGPILGYNQPMQSKIFFYGGAGAVTGANFLLDTGGGKLLIDCGLRQGMPKDEDTNAKAFAYDPAEVSHLVVTHAHIDHIGRIPKLVRDGFRGQILSTAATKALSAPLLEDALAIMEQNARHGGGEPLYGEGDIRQAMSLWKDVPYHQKIKLPGDVTLELLDAGHILGSAMALLRRDSGGQARTIVFTGDLGGGNSPLIPKVEDFVGVNYLVMESVYGDRTRPEDKGRRDLLENVIEDSAARGGTLLIPAFSTERTQDLLYEIRTLMIEKRVPSMRVYVDSPLAQKITAAFAAHPEFFAQDIRARVEKGENIFDFPELTFIERVEESRKLHDAPDPKIILAGSGMGSGGRVVGHETWVLPAHNSTVLLVGYQAAGTTGRRLAEGARSVELYHKQTPVACRIEAIYGYSAHMDGEALLEFVGKTKAASNLEEVFVVEGEPASASFLAQRIRDYLGTKATTPDAGGSATIDF